MRRIKSKQRNNPISKISLKIKLILALSVLILFLGAAFFSGQTGKRFLSDIRDVYRQVMSKTHLSLQVVNIEGHNRTTKEQVVQVLNLKQGMPILDVDLLDVQSRIAELPWVDSVSVERHLPDTIHIRIAEKTPIAVWQNNKTYFPLDETGEPIDDNETVLSGLILVVGRDAPEYTADLIMALRKYPDIMDLVVSAVRVGDRRWNLILRDITAGTTVYLPETDIEEALTRLMEWQETEHVLDKDFSVIDLRIEDRLIVRTDAALTEEKE